VSDSLSRVQSALRSAGHPDEVRSFPEGTRTAADAARAVGCEVAAIAKSIVFRDGDRCVVVVASGANRVDQTKVEAVLGHPVAKAEARWIREVTGFAIGGVAPVGHLTRPVVLLDQDLWAIPVLWAAAGRPDTVFATSAERLLEMTGGVRADIAANPS